MDVCRKLNSEEDIYIYTYTRVVNEIKSQNCMILDLTLINILKANISRCLGSVQH